VLRVHEEVSQDYRITVSTDPGGLRPVRKLVAKLTLKALAVTLVR
jgi:hypothetical protein